jgi:hypothetical protein
MSLNLADCRAQLHEACRDLEDRDGLYGGYRSFKGRRPDLYASLDIALIRTIAGEDLMTSLSPVQRAEWCQHINSFARRNYALPGDGSYEDTYGHSILHAHGMVIGALGVLGGRMPYPCRLYDPFATPELVPGWLETIDWQRQWSASHLFWGGMHCFSFSAVCTPAWLDAVFAWLDANLDRGTGWWRKGVPHSDRHQPLGGSVHIVPIYQHHGRSFPCPERVIDSVLALQLENGRWLDGGDPHPMHYLELDALYALKVMRDLVPAYRRDAIEHALDRYIALVERYWERSRHDLFALHPHRWLAAAGTLGLLQQHRPDRFSDDARWTDIFTDPRFYRSAAVEAPLA